MATDTLILECPKCKKTFPISTYSDERKGKVWGIDNAPFHVIAEVHLASRKNTIRCIHCGLSIGLQVTYMVFPRRLSDLVIEGWQDTLLDINTVFP